MNLPTVVNAYFEADRGNDVDAVVQHFHTDAVVEDEGARHQGSAAIRAWWLRVKETYHHVAEPIGASDSENAVCVRARVSGQFPNSPATLEFLFAIRGDKIAKLKIQ